MPIKGVILDIDGVLTRGQEPVPGSPEAAGDLHNLGVTISYLTNNSTRTRGHVRLFLKDMGFPDAPVVTSAYGAAVYIKETMGEARCLVVGEKGLIKELERYGHEAVPAGEARGCSPVARAPWLPESGDELDDIEVDFVVAGLDRTLTYTKLADALRSIRNGASLIATNDDPTLPWEGGKVLPGAGTVIAALERCSGVRAKVLGKPKPYTTFIAAREMGLEPKDILMIGDRLDTDIAAGRAAGCSVAMVLSGDMKDPGEEDLPTYPNLRELVNDIFL